MPLPRHPFSRFTRDTIDNKRARKSLAHSCESILKTLQWCLTPFQFFFFFPISYSHLHPHLFNLSSSCPRAKIHLIFSPLSLPNALFFILFYIIQTFFQNKASVYEKKKLTSAIFLHALHTHIYSAVLLFFSQLIGRFVLWKIDW